MTAGSFEPAVLKTIPNATLNATMAEEEAVVMAEVEAAAKAEEEAVVKVVEEATERAVVEAAAKVAAAEEAWTSLASFRLQLERQMVTIRIHRISSKDF